MPNSWENTYGLNPLVNDANQDLDGDGATNLQEFENIYTQVFPTGNPCKFSGFVFNVFDSDHSGTITFDEFITALSVTSRGNLDEKLDCEFILNIFRLFWWIVLQLCAIRRFYFSY